MDEVVNASIYKTPPQNGFVVTEYIENLAQRAMAYLQAGFPVHFQGPSGTGKTSLALHLAHQIGRPLVLMHGDDDLTAGDMVGGLHGYRRRILIDNFVHSVLKREEDWERKWLDSRLTVACQHGLTLVYDEFTRSHPEANNILLSILEEKVLELPDIRSGQRYLRVHPEFRAIFTSNPEEYAGVYKSQDALRDRMVTIELGSMDTETEIAITAAKSGMEQSEAALVVEVVRSFSTYFPTSAPTVRRSIMIARVAQQQGISPESEMFRQICVDILASEVTRRNGAKVDKETIGRTIRDIVTRYQITSSRRRENEPEQGAAGTQAATVPWGRR